MENKTLLIDADVLRYQIAFANQDDIVWDDDDDVHQITHPEKASNDCESFLVGLKEQFKTDDVVIVLSAKNNFRMDLDDTYKANRKDKPKPVLWQLVSDYLEWGDHGHKVVSQDGLEGDDLLGILHTGQYLGRSIILTIDKDMLTVPGLIYRWTNHDAGVVPVSPQDAAFFHLTQVLCGDPVDNYKGCPGIGPKKSEAIMDQCRDPLDYWEAIVETYEKKGLSEDDALLQARLAFILRDGWYNFDSQEVTLWTPQQLHAVSMMPTS